MLLRNHCCRRKTVNITHFCVWLRVRVRACFLACSLNYSARNAPPFHLRPLWLYNIFRHYLTSGKIFEKQLLNIKCVFWFSLQLLFETFLHIKYSLFLTYFNKTWIFSTYFFEKKLKYQISSKSVKEAKLFHADERTDMPNLIDAFRNFA